MTKRAQREAEHDNSVHDNNVGLPASGEHMLQPCAPPLQSAVQAACSAAAWEREPLEPRPTDRQTTRGAWVALASGLPVGLFLGLAMGLTVNPIAASVTGSLMTLLIAVSTVRSQRVDETGRRLGLPAHLVGFALAAVPAVLLGLYLRTHDALSPHPRAIVAEWQAAGLPANEARAVALSKFGLTVPVGDDPWKAEIDAIRQAIAGIGLEMASNAKKVADERQTPPSKPEAPEGGKPKPIAAPAPTANTEGGQNSPGGYSFTPTGTGLFHGQADACRVLKMLGTGASLGAVKDELARLGSAWKQVIDKDVRSDPSEERSRLSALALARCAPN